MIRWLPEPPNSYSESKRSGIRPSVIAPLELIRPNGENSSILTGKALCINGNGYSVTLNRLLCKLLLYQLIKVYIKRINYV